MIGKMLSNYSTSNIGTVLRIWKVLLDNYPKGMTAYMISKKVILPISSVYSVIEKMVADGILIRKEETHGNCKSSKSVYVLNSAFVNRDIYKKLEEDIYAVIVEFLKEGIPCVPSIVGCNQDGFKSSNSVCRECVFNRLVNIATIYVTSAVYDILYDMVFEVYLEKDKALDVE